MNFSGLLLYWGPQGGAMEEVPPPHHLGRAALTDAFGANGRKGANQENLDLFSVSHSVCVLFSGFS